MKDQHSRSIHIHQNTESIESPAEIKFTCICTEHTRNNKSKVDLNILYPINMTTQDAQQLANRTGACTCMTWFDNAARIYTYSKAGCSWFCYRVICQANDYLLVHGSAGWITMSTTCQQNFRAKSAWRIFPIGNHGGDIRKWKEGLLKSHHQSHTSHCIMNKR